MCGGSLRTISTSIGLTDQQIQSYKIKLHSNLILTNFSEEKTEENIQKISQEFYWNDLESIGSKWKQTGLRPQNNGKGNGYCSSGQCGIHYLAFLWL